MKIISLFNNKGGVGKSTLSYHLGCALGELGKKVLFVDLDPQCNLTINAMMENELEQIWNEEDPYMDDFSASWAKNPNDRLFAEPRSVHLQCEKVYRDEKPKPLKFSVCALSVRFTNPKDNQREYP